MIYTVTGFFNTGSSAVTDIIKECSGIYVKNNFEVRFAYDPDGISDLEFNLVNNPSRHNGSTAIKRFKRAMEKLDHIYFYDRYKKRVDSDFVGHTNEYLRKLTCLSYPGYYHYDIWEKSKLFYVLNGFVHRMKLGKGTLLSKNEKNYFGITDEERFLSATKEYTYKVLNSLNERGYKDIFFDQLIPPSNTERYLRYFDNIKAVIVDRDPRDVYILSRYILKNSIAPRDVNTFCDWYRWIRDICYKDPLPDNVLKIQFEEMVYSYDVTVKKILDHYGISGRRHVRQKKYFNPDISKKNTQLWNRYKGFDTEAEKIKEKLMCYCYDFPESDAGEKRDAKGRYDVF